MKKLRNASNQTVMVSQSQFDELLDMQVIDLEGKWLEIAIESEYPCWNFLAIGLDQIPGEIMIEIELENKFVH